MAFVPDGALYPDVDPPGAIRSAADRIDFLARLCGAWDFGVLPSLETIAEVRRPEWRAAVEDALVLTSHTYHLLRAWHGLAPVPYLGTIPAFVRDDPQLRHV